MSARLASTRRGRVAVLSCVCLALALLTRVQAGATMDQDPMDTAKTTSQALAVDAAPARFADAAQAIGTAVDEVRRTAPMSVELSQLRADVAGLHQHARSRLHALEAEVGEDEAALERLYRSRDWDQLSYAMAAFRYWQAWLDLTIGERAAGAPRLQSLHAAQRGFKSALVQFFHPGLVYGAWLGLAHVALAEDRHDDAATLLKRLEEVLAREPGNTLRQAVATELDLIRARQGQAQRPISPAGAELSPQEARQLRVEALAILEQGRRSGQGVRAAASHLQRLLASEYVNDALLADLLAYRREIIGHDIGPFSDLVDAEDAFVNGHFYGAAKKYAAFFAGAAKRGGLDLDPFRYRHAVACLRSGLPEQAIAVVEPLTTTGGALYSAAVKLSYIANAARYQAAASEDNLRALAAAARRFIANAPDDAAAAAARLTLAGAGDDVNAMLAALKQARKSGPQAGKARRAQFDLVTGWFQKALRELRMEQAEVLAREALQLAGGLSAPDSRDTGQQVLLLQMRVLAGTGAADLPAEIDRLEANPHLPFPLRDALLWSRLQLLQRTGSMEALGEFLRKLAASGPQPWQLERIYGVLHQLDEPAVVLDACEALLPMAGSASAARRRLELLRIEKLIALQRHADAQAAARSLVVADPRSGRGWMLLAEAALLNGDAYEADRAWRTVTSGTGPGTDLWWQGMEERLRIRSRSTRPQSACELLDEIAGTTAQLSEAHRARVDFAAEQARCNARARS